MGSVTPEQPYSYKYKWARYVAREALEADFELLNAKLAEAPNLRPGNSIEELINNNAERTGYAPGPPPKKDGKFKVGIVGAGAAGLFTAMILDFLNGRVKGLNIDYDVLEAGNETRLGGRLYTHYFSPNKLDYVDIGAMRFPVNDIMTRVFKLFKYIGIEDKLIPYYMSDKDSDGGKKPGNCPSYYNDIHWVGKPSGEDPFQVNKGLPEGDKVDKELLSKDPGDVINEAIHALREAFKKTMTSGASPEEDLKGWKQLMAADYMSTRQFFREKEIKDLPDGPGFNFNTTEWLETFAYATGWYNQSLAETVLESLDFDAKEFKCLEGGAQQIAYGMAKMLTKQPEYNMEVSAIDATRSEKEGITRLKINNRLCSETEYRDYYAVFNSTTLGALQRMDLTKAGLSYGTKQAIRSLGYGASCKVAMKFKTGWWMKEPYNIKGGLGKTDLPLRVCVYPSYNLNEADKNCTLLCSYTWAQDAQRLGSLISPDSPKNENELLETLFHNLALLHKDPNKTYEETLKMIQNQYITHYSYDWYSDQNQSGAFAYFGPGQFSRMWPQIIKPHGWLFLIGEAASAHHAWVTGSLESAVRGVYQMLDMLNAEQRGKYDPYKEAMKLLSDPEGKDLELPFGPLPDEMPKKPKGVESGTQLTDLPEETNKNVALDFTTAQVIMSYLDAIAEEALAEQAMTTNSKAQASQVTVQA